MGRLKLHRFENETGLIRLTGLVLVVMLGGLFSASLVWLVMAEADSSLFSAVWRSNACEWSDWSAEIPVALSLILVPAAAALTVGAHSFRHGGFLGFLISLANLFPLAVYSTRSSLGQLQTGTLTWCAFFVGALACLYIGDLGSWLCRRRAQLEALEEDLPGSPAR